MQFTLFQVIAIAAALLIVALIGLVALRKKAPAAMQMVDAALDRAELSIEGRTDAELVKLAGMIYAHLSDDSEDQQTIAAAAALAASQTEAANASIAQRASARAKFIAIAATAGGT